MIRATDSGGGRALHCGDHSRLDEARSGTYRRAGSDVPRREGSCMRRAILAVIAGAAVLAGSACDSDATDTPEAAVQSAAPTAAASTSAPDYSASTKLVCSKLQTLYT